MALRGTGRSPANDSGESWTRAVDRMNRAVHRYHEQVAMIPDRRLRNDLLHIGERLDSSMIDIVAASQRAEVRTGQDGVVLRAVGRAATTTAHATEAALMAADALRRQQQDDVARCLDTVRALAGTVRELADACRPGHPA